MHIRRSGEDRTYLLITGLKLILLKLKTNPPIISFPSNAAIAFSASAIAAVPAAAAATVAIAIAFAIAVAAATTIAATAAVVDCYVFITPTP
jgi:hypothetical protein